MDCHSVDTDFVCDPDKNESVFVGKDSYSDDTDFVSIPPKKKRCSPRLKTKDSSAPRQSRTEPKHIHVPNPAPATCGKKRKQPESIQKTDAMSKLIDKFNMKLQSRHSQLVKDAIQYFESRIASSDAEIIAEFRDEIRNSFGAPAQDEDADNVNEDDHVPVDEDDHVPAKANEEDSIPAKDIEEDMAPSHDVLCPLPVQNVGMIDMVSAIEELSGLTTRELSEMLKESENFVLQSKTEDGCPKQVDIEKLVSSLPRHLLAVCLELGRGSDLTYVLHGMRFLHSLSELATRHTRLEQVLLDDVKLSEQVMDLIFFVLSILSHWKEENHLGASPFVHSSLVAASLHLLTSYFSSQWHELVHILLAHPKVDIFMDVAFDSLHEDVRSLSVRLSTLGTEAFPVGPLDSRLTHFICQQCEASLQFLLLLCQQKLFRDRILKNKELSRNGGILSLSRTILKLGVPECLKGSTDIAASISRLKAKILSILLQLCEAESVSYLDEVATSPKSMQLGQALALEVLDLLKTAFGRKQKLTSDSHDKSYPMGSVLISALRLVDVFSDDSNFRSSFITNTIPFLTQILAIPHDEFVSSWCSVNLPVIEEDANLDYDPFGAAELALVAAANKLTEAKANYSCPFRPISMPSIAYAQTRTSCVVKIIANLHVFVPNICEEQERDLFLQKFQKYLMTESPKPSVDHPASDDLMATTVCRNLGSLSEYAKSLIPNNLLNEEDVQLLSEFAYKLQNWCKSQVGQSTLQVVKSDTSSESKEDLKPVLEPLPTRASAPDSNMSNLAKDVHNMEESAPTPSMKQEGNARVETPRNCVTINGRLLQNSVGQDLVHLGVARTTSAGYLGVGTATSTGLQHCKMDLDPASRSMDHFKTPEPTKESGLQDDEKGDTNMYDERQPKRRKRTIMNDRQVNEIEKALVDEPEMHKNATLLQAWAEELSGQGSEITSSQLKNWLNNRKAKLARIAKERGVLYEGENADKPCIPATSHFGDSSESAGEDSYLPPARVMSALGISKGSRLVSPDSSEPTSQLAGVRSSKSRAGHKERARQRAAFV